MKCPRCGNELTIDSHRKIPLHMCYECGYIEGRTFTDSFSDEGRETNFQHIRKLEFNESVAFLSKKLGINEETLQDFLDATYED